MKIVIPMAGEGSRFTAAGYTFPKPLIDVEGVPMIERVVNNLYELDADFIFLLRKEHLEKYQLRSLLETITVGRCDFVVVDGLTEGAACTVLLAKEYINSAGPLLIANSDQVVKYSPENFKLLIQSQKKSAHFIWTFYATNPKWSFARLGDDGRVIEVAEKNPISTIATCGIYYWSQGKHFVHYAERMIKRNRRVNGEFYVCPVFNEAIEDGHSVYPFYVDEMWGLGTPEDLNAYLNRGQSR